MAEGKDSNVVELKKNAPDEDAVIALNLGKMKRAKEEFESANGAYRSVLKHVEAKGINLKAAKEAIAIQKSGKVEEEIEYLTRKFLYLKILGLPVQKNQLDLFAVEEPRTPSVDKARSHGRYCGLMGLGMNENPYAPDSEAGQAWLDAWNGGCKERELVLAMEPAGTEVIKGDDTDDDEVFEDEEEAIG